MNVVNLFFPTEFLRDEYIKALLAIDRSDDFATKESHKFKKITFRNIYQQIPGYWASIEWSDTEDAEEFLKRMQEKIPAYWFEKHLFFPEVVSSPRIMEEKWRQKYSLGKEGYYSKAWNVFHKEVQLHLQDARVDVAYIAVLFIYKNNPYFLKKYKRYYIFEELAYYYEAIGELSKSIRCLQIQSTLNPKSIEPYLNMSSFLLLNGLFDEAIDACHLGLMIDEDDEYLNNNILTAYFRGKYYQDALEHLKSLVRKQPEKSTYWKLMGDSFFELNNIVLAIVSYEKALILNSEDVGEIEQDIYYGLGVCYQQLKQYNEAIRSYKKLLRINDSDPGALLNLSKIYGENFKKYHIAKYYAEKMVNLYPQDGFGHYNIGLIYLYTNQYEKAKWHLYRARKMIPDYKPVHEAIEKMRKHMRR
ncbi:MAG: tetratricopeptide repeat protein [Alkaliphilus sp.]|nr:tetratricopeptide repeat protein [Alkaliphilus sp.]